MPWGNENCKPLVSCHLYISFSFKLHGIPMYMIFADTPARRRSNTTSYRRHDYDWCVWCLGINPRCSKRALARFVQHDAASKFRLLTECFNLDACSLVLRCHTNETWKRVVRHLPEPRKLFQIPISRSYKMPLFRSSLLSRVKTRFTTPPIALTVIFQNTFSQWSSFHPLLLPYWLLSTLWCRPVPAYLA